MKIYKIMKIKRKGNAPLLRYRFELIGGYWVNHYWNGLSHEAKQGEHS